MENNNESNNYLLTIPKYHLSVKIPRSSLVFQTKFNVMKDISPPSVRTPMVLDIGINKITSYNNSLMNKHLYYIPL